MEQRGIDYTPTEELPNLPAGVCVGGPYDRIGWINRAKTTVFIVEECAPLPPYMGPFEGGPPPIEKIITKRHAYFLDELRFPENGRIYFWRHEELSSQEAVERVFQAYFGGNQHGQETKVGKR